MTAARMPGVAAGATRCLQRAGSPDAGHRAGEHGTLWQLSDEPVALAVREGPPSGAVRRLLARVGALHAARARAARVGEVRGAALPPRAHPRRPVRVVSALREGGSHASRGAHAALQLYGIFT